MARAQSRDGSEIAFDKAGNGPVLIIVGGALSDRKLNGDSMLVGALKEHYTVYTYDRRGRGESSDTKPYAVDREIEDIEALIEKAGGTAYLYGVSSGAALALQTAAKLGPTKVSKLALYDPPYGQPPRDFARQKDGLNERVRTGQPGDAAAFFLAAIGTPPEVLDGLKASPEWERMKKIDFTIAYDYEVLGDGQVPEAIVRTISIPTLVMTGEKTSRFMHPAADRIAGLIPNARRTTVKDQTHQARPEAVTPLLIEFFGKAT